MQMRVVERRKHEQNMARGSVIWICSVMAIVTLCITFLSCSKSKPSEPQDSVPPTVYETSPAAFGKLDSLHGPVTVGFIEAMLPSSITASTFWVDGKPGTVSYANYVASFTPVTPFEHNATYTAHVAASVKDAAGNVLGQQYNWSFTTRNWTFVPLVIAADTPATEENGVKVVISCSDGNYAMVGWEGSPIPNARSDVYLAKVDTNGTILWRRVIDIGYEDRTVGIVQTADNGFVLAGTTGEFDISAFLLKTDATGNVQWQKTITAHVAIGNAGVTLAADGNPVAFSASTITKFSASTGDSLWSAAVTPGYTVTGLCRSTSPTEGFIYACYTHGDIPPAVSMAVGKIDSDGDSVWCKELIHGHYQVSYPSASVLAHTDGDYVIFGGLLYDGMGGRVVFKVGTNGDMRWSYADDIAANIGPFFHGFQFRDGCIGIVPLLTGNGGSGLLTYFGSAGNVLASRNFGGSLVINTRQQGWPYAGVARGDNEIIVVGEMTPDYNVIDKPKRALFIRMRYM